MKLSDSTHGDSGVQPHDHVAAGPDHAAAAGTFGVHLSVIEDRLGDDFVHIVRAEKHEDPLVQALDIYDARSADIGGTGVLLSLISAEAMRPEELRRALSSAASSGCVGVAFTSDRDTGTAVNSLVLTLAEEAGLAAVILAPQIGWREFDALITRLLGESAQSLALAPSSGDKLFALADTVARAFGGSVAIENHQREVLAHSSVQHQAIDELRTTGILFRRASDAPVNEQRYREVLAADGIVRFERYRNYLPRAAIAVRAGSIPLGTIWALDPQGDRPADSPLDGEKTAVLEEAAELAADLLLNEWRGSNRETSRREASFARMLLSATQPGDRQTLDPQGNGVAVLLRCIVSTPRPVAQLAEIRLALGRTLATFLPGLVITNEGNEIIALCPTTKVEAVRRWTTAGLAELPTALSRALEVGLSDPHPISSGLPYAYTEAGAVAVCAHRVGEPVGTVERLRPQLFLDACRVQLERDDRLVLPEVRDLIDDPTAPPWFLETLECWLQETGSVARTARRLRVHEQTVRYRIRRIRERLPLAERGPDYLLSLWAQVRALRPEMEASAAAAPEPPSRG